MFNGDLLNYLYWLSLGRLDEAGPGLADCLEEEDPPLELEGLEEDELPGLDEEEDDDDDFKDFRTAGWNSGPTILGFFFSMAAIAAFWASSLFLSFSFLFASSSSFFFLAAALSGPEDDDDEALSFPPPPPFPARWAGGSLPALRS